MGQCWFNHKKTEKYRQKYNLPDIHHVSIGNGDHRISICMKDGSEFNVEMDGSLTPSSPWSFHTSDFNKPVPVDSPPV